MQLGPVGVDESLEGALVAVRRSGDQVALVHRARWRPGLHLAGLNARGPPTGAGGHGPRTAGADGGAVRREPVIPPLEEPGSLGCQGATSPPLGPQITLRQPAGPGASRSMPLRRARARKTHRPRSSASKPRRNARPSRTSVSLSGASWRQMHVAPRIDSAIWANDSSPTKPS